MKKLFVLTALALFALATSAFAQGWTEDFESGTANWSIADGSGPINTAQTPNDPRGESYWVAAGQTQRIFREFNLQDAVILKGWFYDSSVSTGTSRGFIGMQAISGGVPVVSNALMRIGKNNQNVYQFHYFAGGLQTINLQALSVGWHYVELTWQPGRIDYKLDDNVGFVENDALTVAPSGVVLGYNYGNGIPGSGVDLYFDDINVAAVPEPSSMFALASGLVGMAGFVVRRRK